MKTYNYQIVRYIHDQVTGEFVNVGIIVFHPKSNFLKGRFLKKYNRISHFFKSIKGDSLISTLRNIEAQLQIEEARLKTLFRHSSLEQITNDILPPDNSALVCTPVKSGIDIDVNSALDDLYQRLVNEYVQDKSQEGLNDIYVWKKLYKKYFDKHDITSRLQEHVVATPYDEIIFDKAWKNGSWNVFQSLGFNLQREDIIKSKTYKWSGILNELENTSGKLHVYFLTNKSDTNPDISGFVNATLGKHQSNNLTITVVQEDEAENFALKVKEEMEEAGQ